MNIDMAKPVQLIADGLIPTTEILSRQLRATGRDVQVVPAQTLGSASMMDFCIISRLCHPEFSWLPAYFQRKGKRYVYYLDDNFFEIDYQQSESNARFFRHPAVRDTLSRFITGAACVVVQSEPLKQYLSRAFPEKDVILINAAVDWRLFADAVRKAGPGARATPLRVGYATTPRYHLEQLISDIVRLAWERFADRVEFEFVGWWPRDVVNSPNVKTYPAINGYEQFVEFVCSRHWDAGLAPLGESLFENSKTNLKFREYAAMSVPGIYSDVPLYSSCVAQNDTGLLCRNDATDWVAAIARLLDDTALRARIVERSRAYVEEHHSQEKVAARFDALLTQWQGEA